MSRVPKRLRARREVFVATRGPLSHHEFCTRLSVSPELAGWVIRVRRAIALVCAVPPAALHPEDTWEDIVSLQCGDWDVVEVFQALEELGVEFPRGTSDAPLPRFVPGRFLWLRWPAPATFGEWVVVVAMYLIERGCRLTRRCSGPGPRGAVS